MKVPRSKYILFAIASLLYGLFVIWIGAFWFLFGILLIFDHFITRFLFKIRKLIKLPAVLTETLEWIRDNDPERYRALYDRYRAHRGLPREKDD